MCKEADASNLPPAVLEHWDSVGRGKADKARFMNIAEGSVEECRYYLILANDLHYGDTGRLNTLLEEVSRLLNAYAGAIL